MDKIIDSLVKAAGFMRTYPMTIFIVLTIAFGAAYWQQTSKLEAVLTEIGQLRAEVGFLREAYVDCEGKR